MPRFGSTPSQLDVFEIDIAALDHLLSSPVTPDPSSIQVFRSRTLMRIIVSYQDGLDEVTLLLVKFLNRVYLPCYDLHDTLSEAFAPFHPVFQWWQERHGTSKLLLRMPRAPLLCYAITHNNIPVLEALQDNGKLALDEIHWDLVGRQGHVKLLQFLLARGTTGSLPNVIFNAVVYGHLPMVQFLHEFGASFTWELLVHACVFGKVEVVQYLHQLSSIGDVGWDPDTIDCVARRGHLNVLRFLHQCNYVGFTSHTMDVAAEAGQLEIVRFLHEHRYEGCTAAAMIGAVRNGHLEVVKFLDLYRPDAASDNVVVVALHYGQEAILNYFQEERKLKKRLSRIQKRVAVLVRNNNDTMRNPYNPPKSKICCA
ncbi:hypothetical protein THRCLA_06968 [Thraustotheca clavata]|uniref:Uncharacterized protein n=1 Tax=Thraustotheca clavata TaxID=74557 RepID=A0A1V9ZHI8_9STRA|nr:hypothetical protein THRCLA_06968 [Thraustotheca clavata]